MILQGMDTDKLFLMLGSLGCYPIISMRYYNSRDLVGYAANSGRESENGLPWHYLSKRQFSVYGMSDYPCALCPRLSNFKINP